MLALALCVPVRGAMALWRLIKHTRNSKVLREDRGEYTAVLIPEVTREKLHTRPQRSDLVSNGNTYSLVAARAGDDALF